MIEIHDYLNPKLWDNFTLKPDVKKACLDICNEFIDNLDIEINVADIQLVGSNAAYNYTPTSDIDLHIIVNFELLQASKEILTAYFNSEKSKFNSTYDISIKQHPVEIYVEDINSSVLSNGIYSLIQDKWIKKPVKHAVPQYDLSTQLRKFDELITKALLNTSIEDIECLINSIYMMRKNSLQVDGEYGQGNQLFKELRNRNYLDKLKERLLELKSENLTLESLHLGQIVSRLDT